ncbi:MAG: site-specific DNA-methyltransferase [Thermoplasmata archaeon]|nr:site-specific DNA-methyltransferase [Thermoplasmata archaeon]
MRRSGRPVTTLRGSSQPTRGVDPVEPDPSGQHGRDERILPTREGTRDQDAPPRFPKELLSFFVRLTTDPGQIVLDPFAGSNTSCWVAQSLHRRWISFELDSMCFRFSRTTLFGTSFG